MNNWLDITWKYRRPITIDNTNNSNTLTDYQIKLSLNSSNFDFSKANSDGSDIRFTDSDGVTKLSYWIENWDSTNQTATVWVKVNSIPASSTKDIYMYYGNPSATSESNGDDTFVFFDDFNSGSLDGNKWYSNGASVSGGTCKLDGDSSNHQKGIKTKQTFPNTIHVYTRCRRSSSGDLDPNLWYTDISITSSSTINGPDQNGLAIWATENSGSAGLYLNKSKKISLDNYTTTSWTDIEFRPTSGDLYAKIGSSSGHSNTTHSYNNQPITIAINSSSGYNLYVDYIRVVNYTSPAPSETVGNEELTPRNQYNSSFYSIYIYQLQYKELTAC